MARERKFQNKVANNARERELSRSSYGFLRLPENIKLFSPEGDSEVTFDIVPYIITNLKHGDRNDENGVAQVGDEWYKVEFKIHRDIGPENDAVVCPSSIGKRCPICEAISDMRKEAQGDEEALKVISDLRAKNRVLYNVIPIGVKGLEEVPHIWEFSHFNFQKLLETETKFDESKEEFADLSAEWGRTLKVRFKEESFGTNKYPKADRIDFEKRNEDYAEDFAQTTPNLDKVLIIHSYDKLNALFMGVDGEDEEPNSAPHDEESAETVSGGTDSSECMACSGSGKNSKGNECKPCRGTGQLHQAEAAEKEEETGTETPEAARRRKKREEAQKQAEAEKAINGDNLCPHGKTYGVDVDEFKACRDCDLWDNCFDEGERLKGEASK
jgi:hypothetical protein